jgi:hypothetical protein
VVGGRRRLPEAGQRADTPSAPVAARPPLVAAHPDVPPVVAVSVADLVVAVAVSVADLVGAVAPRHPAHPGAAVSLDAGRPSGAPAGAGATSRSSSPPR